MDRIGRAIELSKHQPKHHRGSAETMQQADGIGEITYTQTRRLRVEHDFLREQRLISSIQDERIIDSYKLLRTRVMRRLQQNNWKTLGVTSAREDEGKTLTAVNLGMSIALKLDQTVLIVDADLRRPSVHNLFGIQPEYGLRDHLESGVPVDDLLVNPGIDRIVILPGSSGGGGSSELLSSARMIQLVKELKARYPSRIVIFDMPPMLVGDDVAAFAPQLDAVMVVVEDDKTEMDDLVRGLEVLEDVNLIGTVLNKSFEMMHGYDYYY